MKLELVHFLHVQWNILDNYTTYFQLFRPVSRFGPKTQAPPFYTVNALYTWAEGRCRNVCRIPTTLL